MRSSTFALTAALLFSGAALAAVGGPRGNAAAGQQRFETAPEGGQACASCHLDGGTGSIDGNTPLLAGQYPDYLEKALKDYRGGVRKNVIMAAQASSLTDAEIADLAAFLASRQESVHVFNKAD